jgi:Icc-related predicted phosphoesterase
LKNGKTIKLLSVSDAVESTLDQRVDAELKKNVDLIVSCGDLPPEYLFSGNHDIRYKETRPEGGLDLHGRLVDNEGINILGLEGSHWYNGGPYQYTEGQMRSIIRRLRPALWWRGGVDVVITHAPPRHIHDAEDPCHKGFECFRWLIEKYQPSYFIHGHIHQNFGDPSERVTVYKSTKVVNTYGHCVLEIQVPSNTQPRR